MTCWASMTDAELADAAAGIAAEMTRRASVAQLERLATEYAAGLGRHPGDAWVQPTSALDAYRVGDEVAYGGRVWRSLVDWNVWQPGNPSDPQAYRWWQDLTPPPEPEGPTGPPDWTAGVSYKAGDLVTYGAKGYRCRQAHTSLPGWEPPNVPALWEVAL